MKAASHWDKPTIKLGKRDETEVAIFWVKDRDAVVRAQLCWEETHIRTIFRVASSRSVKWLQKNERRYPDKFDVRLKGFLQFPNPNKSGRCLGRIGKLDAGRPFWANQRCTESPI